MFIIRPDTGPHLISHIKSVKWSSYFLLLHCLCLCLLTFSSCLPAMNHGPCACLGTVRLT